MPIATTRALGLCVRDCLGPIKKVFWGLLTWIGILVWIYDLEWLTSEWMVTVMIELMNGLYRLSLNECNTENLCVKFILNLNSFN